MRRFIIGLSVAVLTGLIAVGLAGMYRKSADERPVSRTRYIMGTLMLITAYDARAERAIEAAFARMAEIEAQVGGAPGSDISKLNTGAGKRAVKIGSDTLKILSMARRYAKITGGAFDVTVGPLVELWGFGYGGAGRLAGSDEVARVMPLIGEDKLWLDPDTGRARLAKPGMSLAMGGIAKGYAVEEAVKVLRAKGVKNAIVNGGNSSVKVIGHSTHGRDWRVGIEDPRHLGKMLGVLTLCSGQALGTSADDRRFFVRNGRRYSHLIDPRTGYPSRKGLAQVTVVTADAAAADILTKAFFLNGVAWSMQFARENNLEAIMVDDRDQITATPGVDLK